MSMTIEDCSAVRQPRPVPDTPTNVLEQLSMKGKVVVVTGASDGLGYAAIEACAEAGADVVLWYNSNDIAIKKAEELAKAHSIRAKAYQCEVSQVDKVRATIDQVVSDFGRIDVFVANAGMAISKPILEQTVEEYKRQMEVNVDGVFYCAKYVGEVFKRQGKGNLIITSSMSAHIVNVPVDQPCTTRPRLPSPTWASRSPGNGGNFARVNIVSPGFFDTKLGASERVVKRSLSYVCAWPTRPRQGDQGSLPLPRQ